MITIHDFVIFKTWTLPQKQTFIKKLVWKEQCVMIALDTWTQVIQF